MDVRLRCLRLLAAVRQEQSTRDNPTPHIDARHEEPLAPYFTSESESTRLLLNRSIKMHSYLSNQSKSSVLEAPCDRRSLLTVDGHRRSEQ